MRADSYRILIVAPGSLVEQWRDELFEKFGLEFHIYSSLLEQTSPSGNPFDDYPRLIVRLDQLSLNEELQAKLCAPGWDLAVFDDAQPNRRQWSGTDPIKSSSLRRRAGPGNKTLCLQGSAHPFPDKRGASQLGLLALIGARDTHADILYAEKQMTGRGRRVQI
jgi:hypothetical protein